MVSFASVLETVGLEQVEPDLADGRERRHRVPEPVDGRLAADRDRRRVQQLLQAGAGEGGADDGPAASSITSWLMLRMPLPWV
jgi:hypothetical protein